jgi:class 3 adenylate cyclase/archaellum component FlaG (FlaF/FlaG flagellin family)
MKRTPLAPLPLWIVLIVPFIAQLAIAISVVGYLSWRTGQQAVNDLASQLRSELTERIQQRLDNYIRTPHIINRLNTTAVNEGALGISNTQGGYQFLQQIKVSALINGIYCGNSQGEFFGVTRRTIGGSFDPRNFQMMVSNVTTDYQYQLYDTDNRGNLTHRLQTIGPYDPRQRPWYRAAIQAGRPTWSPVYLDFSSQLPTVTASTPIYEGNAIVGVCGTDVVLSEDLQAFLRELQIGQSGEALIIDRKGALLSSSTDDTLAVSEQQNLRQLQVVESESPLVRATVKHLLDRFGSFEKIRGDQQLEFRWEGQLQFIQVAPFQDGRGLDWLIVLVVPEADFMGRIHENSRKTIALCLLALAIATIIGIFTSRLISRPVVRLIRATEEVAGGQLNQNVSTRGIRELLSLAKSFNSMATQLKSSFSDLEDQRNSFLRFVPAEYLSFLRRDSLVNVALGEHVSTDMAILFSDIRSFTTLSQQMTPSDNFAFINRYLGQVSPAIRDHGGFIVKYLGDGIMAAFPQGARDAVDAAIAQQQCVSRYNQDPIPASPDPIRVGIGIHFGRIMVGIVGETGRMQGDAFSDTVNLAARLEGLTKFYGVDVLISETVLAAMGTDHPYQIRFLDRVVVKGRNEAIAIYEILDATDEQSKVLKLKTQPEFDRGITAYQQGDLEGAIAAFHAVLDLNPQDRTAALYLERLHSFKTHGFPDQWQGIWHFTEK